jgi:hypothetical protein
MHPAGARRRMAEVGRAARSTKGPVAPAFQAVLRTLETSRAARPEFFERLHSRAAAVTATNWL